MIKTIFIDRDGVINKDPGGWTRHNYVTDVEDFRFLPGVFEALRFLTRHGVRAIVISNQAGVAKGYFTKEKLDKVNAYMLNELSKKGARIERSYYCIHKDEDNCNCRKPKTGLLEMAAERYGVKPHDTYFIGDGEVDMTAGRRMGIKTILVLSGKTTLNEAKRWKDKPDYIFKDLLEAVKWLLEKEKRRNIRSLKRKDRVGDTTDMKGN